jgi:hypothetical protein
MTTITEKFNWVKKGILSGEYDIESLLQCNKYMLWEILDYMALKKAKVEISEDKIQVSIKPITYILTDESYLCVKTKDQVIEGRFKEKEKEKIKDFMSDIGLI